jgi:hypothetical protein
MDDTEIKERKVKFVQFENEIWIIVLSIKSFLW